MLWRLRNVPVEALYVVVYVVLGLTLLLALVTPPNTWDGMTYHMSRVVHWLQNGSLAFYPTDITRQNEMPPLGEEAILHLQGLSSGDRFANLPAWFGFCGSLVVVHLLARTMQLRRCWVGFATILPR